MKKNIKQHSEKPESVLEWLVRETLTFFIRRTANWSIHLSWIKPPPANTKVKDVCDIIRKRPDNTSFVQKELNLNL